MTRIEYCKEYRNTAGMRMLTKDLFLGQYHLEVVINGDTIDVYRADTSERIGCLMAVYSASDVAAPFSDGRRVRIVTSGDVEPRNEDLTERAALAIQGNWWRWIEGV